MEQFGTSGVPIPCRMNRPMVEHWYLVVPPLYRYITYPSSFWMSLTIFGISKSNFQRDRKKIPLLVRTFRSNLSTGLREDFEKLSHIPPEKTFTFAPCAEDFLSSGSRWETLFVHNPSQVVAEETKFFMRASSAIFQNASPSGSRRERHFYNLLNEKTQKNNSAQVGQNF